MTMLHLVSILGSLGAILLAAAVIVAELVPLFRREFSPARPAFLPARPEMRRACRVDPAGPVMRRLRPAATGAALRVAA